MFDCLPVDLDFLDTAPIQFGVAGRVARPPDEVFAAVAHDPANWGEFFPGFDTTGRYQTPPPHGVGSRRTVRVAGLKVEETILAWDEGARWAFRVDSAQAPVFHAFIEDYRFEPAGTDATLVRWDVACEPRTAFRIAKPALPHAMRLMLSRASHNLERGRWFSAPASNS